MGQARSTQLGGKIGEDFGIRWAFGVFARLLLELRVVLPKLG